MNPIGKRGEDMAADYLVRDGFLILHRNYRYGRAEIDIIAQKNTLLVFVEVKLRKNSNFGYPETTLSERKIELIHQAASHYTNTLTSPYKIRFDIIAITGDKLERFEDAF